MKPNEEYHPVYLAPPGVKGVIKAADCFSALISQCGCRPFAISNIQELRCAGDRIERLGTDFNQLV
jgi:hypothetical protein